MAKLQPAAHAGVVDIEYVDGTDGQSVAGEQLDVEPSGPRWLRPRSGRVRRPHGALWVAGLVIAIGIGVVAHQSGNITEQAGTQPSLPVASTAAPNYLSAGFTAVLALAHHPGKLTDYIRQTSPAGACAPVRVGYSPVASIVRTAKQYAPRLTGVDSARTLDQFTGLCSIELRGTFGWKSILTVSVSAPAARARHPAAFARIETGITTIDGVTTKYAITVTQTGWRVIVGDVGPGGEAISSRDLLAFAQSPALLW